MLKESFVWVGPVFTLYMIFRWVTSFGSAWTFGRWCMPETLVGFDGLHYRNGSTIDPVTLALVQSGWEPEFNLVCVVIGVATAWYLWHVGLAIEKNRRKLAFAIAQADYFAERRRANGITRDAELQWRRERWRPRGTNE